MKRPMRGADGKYTVNGKKYDELFGSRQRVFNQTAYKTRGNLTKKDLFFNKHGRIVSLKKHKTAKKEKRLLAHGYYTQKGKFGYIRKSVRKTRKNH